VLARVASFLQCGYEQATTAAASAMTPPVEARNQRSHSPKTDTGFAKRRVQRVQRLTE